MKPLNINKFLNIIQIIFYKTWNPNSNTSICFMVISTSSWSIHYDTYSSSYKIHQGVYFLIPNLIKYLLKCNIYLYGIKKAVASKTTFVLCRIA